MPISVGSRLGPYEILAPIGAGGMGEVWRARDAKLDRNVAVKVLPQSVATDPDALARFEREAKAIAALSHPNILAIHDFGNQDGIAYAVMELLEGETLRGKLEAGPIGRKQAVDYALQIARGLAAAHEKGVIHLGHADAVSGRRDEALRLIEELKGWSERGYDPLANIALVHTGLGEKDEAIQWLEKAHRTRSAWIIYLAVKVDPRWDPLRSDGRFQGMLRQMGLSS